MVKLSHPYDVEKKRLPGIYMSLLNKYENETNFFFGWGFFITKLYE